MGFDFISQRQEYTSGNLSKKELPLSPFVLFSKWYELAESLTEKDVNAIVLSTVGKDRRPSSRVVLLKGFDEKGFVFYSNYNSHKGKQLAENPFAAINIFWPHMERQIRIEGRVSKISNEESLNYFHTRPRESQLGALASDQSESIPNRKFLEDKMKALTKKFEGTEIPKPKNWGGYLLQPDLLEFWQGRANRLHDRFEYRLLNNEWALTRLSP